MLLCDTQNCSALCKSYCSHQQVHCSGTLSWQQEARRLRCQLIASTKPCAQLVTVLSVRQSHDQACMQMHHTEALSWLQASGDAVMY